ncbi:hypothetical protein [uncultured Adlercreutzia sp.]|uniref:hypothetical protein n=1 Tax=uncultured Adlercreutzia sp. TaxID=875803 RepID=UPI0025D44B13|nr:hypothetical protein [uncultured Adlercreutzia sp.]MCI9261454.1 hypothetical protein [Eggerthellaceae bacterium]
MSQRNPMNERYQSEDRRGVTRKSAASAKPKSKAAASVTVKSAKKTPEQKKAAEKAARREASQKQREIERKYYKPDTPRYKRMRILWWVLLVAAIGCTTLSFVGQSWMPPTAGVVILVLAYVFIIAAFILDFVVIKKERVAYQERMLAEEEKNAKAEKQARRVQQAKQSVKPKGSGKNQNRHAAPKKGASAEEAPEADASDEPPVKPQRRGLFGSGFRLSNREKMQAEKKAAKEAKAAEKAAQADESK